MERFDFVVIGAGTGGEASAYLARERGASVALVERDLYGGACPFWSCMPSKTLLHAAEIHVRGDHYPWSRASDRRDYMIAREGTDYPSDGSHVHGLEKAGVVLLRGEGRVAGRGRVDVHRDGETRHLETAHIVLAVGSLSKLPNIEGLAAAEPWTNVQYTSMRELPASVVVLGGGPSGVEMAQWFGRYGVRTSIVHSGEYLNPRDHPRSSRLLAEVLRRDGVDVRTGVRASRVGGRGPDGDYRVELSDGSSVTGRVIAVGIGRTSPIAGAGLETLGIDSGGKDALKPDDRLRIAENVYAVGDAAGGPLSTHLAHYQGELAVRIALGEDVKPDYSAIPQALYTEPEMAGVGLKLDEAVQRGHDAFEETTDLGKSAKGYASESVGHATIVVDRREKVLLGAFIAGPGASDAIHEAVLAIKTKTPVAVLADTIHAFPTTSRVLGTSFSQAAKKLA